MTDSEKKSILESLVNQEERIVYAESLEILKFETALSVVEELPTAVRDHFRQEFMVQKDACSARLIVAKGRFTALKAHPDYVALVEI